MARLLPDPYPMTDFDTAGSNWREAVDIQNREMAELQERSDNLPEGEIVGAVVQWQRADGYAVYVVTHDDPLTLQYVPYMDGYTVEPALIRGLERDDILEQLEWRRRWRNLSDERKNT